ncbi:MAG: Asp-tRNA(Asn)/Glu-tRNA(Gln) amidotransferase subunit GatA [Pseudomonadota bacterium]
MDITALTIRGLGGLLARGETTSVELTRAVFERLERLEPKLLCYLTPTRQMAEGQAVAADERRKRGESTPLLGVPIGIKDVLCTKGVRTTCGSKILENFIPPYDATVVARLRSAGAVLCGKLNMDEFAMGSSTENSRFQVTHNPWDLDRIPGGSSGGSAAAVAADECYASLGSDTGGSIRQPAAMCGVVGIKPTYGRVSRFGLVAFASSLDQVGPFTKDVTDCALMLNAICGHDPQDSTSVPLPVPDYTASLGKDVRGLRVGVPKEYFVEGMDPEVAGAVRGAIRQLEGLGCEVVDISLPYTEYAVAVYYIIAPAEASSNLARYDGVKYGLRKEGDDLLDMYAKTRSEGFGSEVKRRIMLGTYALSSGYYDAYYRKASQVRTLIVNDFKQAFERCDVIATPVTPTAAFRIGEKVADPLQMYLSDIFTISTNLAGIPGLSMPCGLTTSRLPIGIQLLGTHFGEERILQVAHALEGALGLANMKPPL